MWSCMKAVHNKHLSQVLRRAVSHDATTLSGRLRLSEEVAEALLSRKPVVALESTIITHGMPYPHNVETARMVERLVRQEGAIPATIAILGGQMHVGLSDQQVDHLGNPKTKAVKTSRRDIGYVLSKGLNGGTTVSGTMIAARKAGIDVFVTGGIGGVHRGAETSLDVSADLTELGRTPVAVVSAGVKSILDIGLTLEYLETEGVCVTTYGESRDFPAFFTPTSGFLSPYNVHTAKDAAQLIDVNLSFELGSGVLIAVPIPAQEAAAGSRIEDAIQVAIRESREKKIAGKEVTPFILARVNEITQGASLAANIALIKNNARVGSQIAVELSKLRNQGKTCSSSSHGNRAAHSNPSKPKSRPVVVGGINVDFTARFKEKNFQNNGATYPGQVLQTFGGVGRNLASCLSRLGTNPHFLSAMGKDNYSQYFFQQASHMDLCGVRCEEGVSSAMYCAVLDGDGELMYGLGDFHVHNMVTPQYIEKYIRELRSAPMVVLDCNIPSETINYVADVCHASGVPVWLEPTDQHLATKPLETGAIRKLSYISPNMNELRIMNAYIKGTQPKTKVSSGDGILSETLDEALDLVLPLLELIPNTLITLGEHGAMLVSQDGDRGKVLHCPARTDHLPPPSIVSVSGAGDCLASAFMTYLIMNQPHHLALKAAILASQLSLKSHHAVPSHMTYDDISPAAISALEPWPITELFL